MKKLLLFIALALVAGCTPPPLQTDIAALEFGMPPDSATVAQQVRWYYELRLFDPTSAIYKFEEPAAAWYVTSADSLRGAWGVVFYQNAKNRLGGYCGFTENIAIFRNDQLKGVYGTTSAKMNYGRTWGWR
jgi:hypothetical protein